MVIIQHVIADSKSRTHAHIVRVARRSIITHMYMEDFMGEKEVGIKSPGCY